MSLHVLSDGSAHPLPDAWSTNELQLDDQAFDQLRAGPLPDFNDVVVTLALAQLLRGEYIAATPEKGRTLDDQQVRRAHRALAACMTRHGLTHDIPWQDMAGFEAYRKSQRVCGWKARRDLVARWFDPLMDQLQELENERLLSSLRRCRA